MVGVIEVVGGVYERGRGSKYRKNVRGNQKWQGGKKVVGRSEKW